MTQSHDERLTPALLMVKVISHDARPEVVKRLMATEHVTQCDAVDGDCDIIATIEPLPGAGLERFVSNRVKAVPDVSGCEVCLVDSLADSRTGDDSTDSTAETIVFVESSPDRFEPIFQTLTVLSATSSCQIAQPPYSFVIRLKGTNFAFLDKVLNEKILPLPGVLRARQHRLLKLTGF